MVYNTKLLLERCNGPVVVESLMRVISMSREDAEEAVLAAGGSLTDPVPRWIKKALKEQGKISRTPSHRPARPSRPLLPVRMLYT